MLTTKFIQYSKLEVTNGINMGYNKRQDSFLGQDNSYSSLNAANYNVPVQNEPKSRKRLSAREAMALTKKRYKETLEYLA